MSGLVTDVTPMLLRAFPNGKPEMSAPDFDRALHFVKGRRNGSIPKPGPMLMDYAFWAHTMIVGWRLLVDEWEKAGRQGPEPKILICPECETLMMLDTSQGDVLMCTGGCHRAITVATFVQLFKRPATAPRVARPAGTNIIGNSIVPPNSSSSSGKKTASLSTATPKGARPEDYGIKDGVAHSKKALVGWRMWNLYPKERMVGLREEWAGKWHLESLSNAHQSSWRPMEPQRGTCNNLDPSEIDDHVCPSWEHRCGVHAVKDVSQTRKWGTLNVGSTANYVRVLGEIEMWGRVLEYEEGYRAEWAYPKKLYLPSSLPDAFGISAEQLAEELWATYLTEVVIDDDIRNIS